MELMPCGEWNVLSCATSAGYKDTALSALGDDMQKAQRVVSLSNLIS